jgi:hypothetical protein
MITFSTIPGFALKGTSREDRMRTIRGDATKILSKYFQNTVRYYGAVAGCSLVHFIFFPFWGGMEPSPLLLRPILAYCTHPG